MSCVDCHPERPPRRQFFRPHAPPRACRCATQISGCGAGKIQGFLAEPEALTQTGEVQYAQFI